MYRELLATFGCDWYEIARETFAELGVDQESIYAVLEATHNVSMHWVE